MKILIYCAILSLSLLSSSQLLALISGSEGNASVSDMGWPEGSVALANLKTRIAMWEGPPFGGGQTTFEFRGEKTPDFNRALELFAKIDAPVKELQVRSGPQDSFWLGIAERDGEGVDRRMDWSFVVWNAESWNRLFNDPQSTFLSDSPNFRKPVAPPLLKVFIGGGCVEWEQVVVPEGVTVKDMRGEAGGEPVISGRVRDIATGDPLEGVELSLIAGEQDAEGELPKAISGADGGYQLKGFPPGSYTVVARKEGYAEKRSPNFGEIAGSDTREDDFALAKVVELSGVVRGPDGNGIAGARVIAQNVIGADGFGYRARENIETRSDAAGRFTLTGLPDGECRLMVWADGLYNPGSVLMKYLLPGDVPVEIRMIGTGTVRGTLRRAGGKQLNVSIQPPGGNKVGSWGGSTNCREDGAFEFKNVPEGTYLVGPTRGGDLVAGGVGVMEVAVKPGEVTTVELVEDRG